MDLVSIYQALLINAGQPLVPNPHTGYVYFLSLAGWFQVLHFLEVLPVYEIDSLMAEKNFEATYAALVVAGRWFSIFLAWILVGLVYASVFTLLKEYRWGRWASLLIGVVLTIGGGGISAQSVMLRTELLSMILIYAAALALMAAPRVTVVRSCWLLGLSGFLIHAALMVKIQNIILIVFLPVLPLVFGWWVRQGVSKLPPQKLIWAVPALAVFLTIPIAIIFIANLLPISHFFYQGIIAIYVISCAFIFGRLNLGGASYGIVGLGAVAIGFSLAYGLIFFSDNWWTTFYVVNFLEQMLPFLPVSNIDHISAVQAQLTPLKDTGLPDSDGKIAILWQSLNSKNPDGTTEVSRFFSERLQNLDYPFVIFYVLVPTTTIILALYGKWEAAAKAAFLCFMAGMIVAICWIGRGFFNFYYSIYVETWVLLAAAIILKDLPNIPDFCHKRWLQAGRLGLLVLIFAIVTINIRFRLLEPVTANPVVAKSTCFVRGLTPLFYDKFDGYCGTFSTEH